MVSRSLPFLDIKSPIPLEQTMRKERLYGVRIDKKENYDQVSMELNMRLAKLLESTDNQQLPTVRLKCIAILTSAFPA